MAIPPVERVATMLVMVTPHEPAPHRTRHQRINLIDLALEIASGLHAAPPEPEPSICALSSIAAGSGQQ